MDAQRVYRSIVLAAVAAPALVLGGCGSDDAGMRNMDKGNRSTNSTTVAVENADIPSDAAFNRADVDFAQQMIRHHTQAIEMADMAIKRAQAPEVKNLAERIRAAQGPEIEQLKSWLRDWGQAVLEGKMSMKSGMGGMSMEGMMTQQQMDGMAATSGAEFDQMFLEMMIVHHKGAVAMAKDQVDNGKFKPAIDMAQSIINGQSAEIQEMEQLRS